MRKIAWNYITAFIIVACVFCNSYMMIYSYLSQEMVTCVLDNNMMQHMDSLLKNKSVFVVTYAIWHMLLVVLVVWRICVMLKPVITKICRKKGDNAEVNTNWKIAIRYGSIKGFAGFVLIFIIGMLAGTDDSIVFWIIEALIAWVCGTVFFAAKKLKELEDEQ